MKKIILASLMCGSFVYAGTYHTLIKKSPNTNYEINVAFASKGITCTTFTPLENEVYKGQSFTQTGSNCTEELESSSGSTKTVPAENQTYSKTGDLLLSSCKEILDNSHSVGDGIYPITYSGYEINVECDMTTDGGGWTRWWWYQTASGTFPTGETDVLGHNFGTFDVSSDYGFQKLPSTTVKSSTQLLAKDGVNVFKWDFASTTGTANAVWNAFHNGTTYAYASALNVGTWNPIALKGSFTLAAQDSFMYRQQGDVKGFILDDDNCDCLSTLNAGPNMCNSSWDSRYGNGSFAYGVDVLNDTTCSSPDPAKKLFMYYR